MKNICPAFFSKSISKSILMAFLSSSAVFAQSNLCGYKDYFHLSIDSPPEITIVNADASPDIYLEIIGPRSFELRDTPRCTSGYVHVTFAKDPESWCSLEIKDGPFLVHPTISAYCRGLDYKGYRYDGLQSYSYSLVIH